MPLKDLIAEHLSHSAMVQPDFFSSAVKAIQNAPDRQRDIVLGDIAGQLGCDDAALQFLFDTPSTDDDFSVPEFRDVLLAAE